MSPISAYLNSLAVHYSCRCESLRWKYKAFEKLLFRSTHATRYSTYTNNNHCTQRPRVSCHYIRAVSVTSCGVSSPHAVLLVFHHCLATVAWGSSQRNFEDYHPLSSFLPSSILMKFITSINLVISGNTNIAYAKKKKSARNTMVFYPQKY